MSPIEWPKVKLADYVDLLSGFPFKSAGFSTASDDIPLVKGENVHQGFIDWNKAKRWPKNQVDGLDKYWLKPGDVVLAMDRPWIEAGLKQACICEHDPASLLVQRVSRLRGENGLLTDYLRHLIGSSMFTDYIKPIVTGTSVPHISGAQIKSFEFRLPPLPMQRRIASILSAYDDLIENNTRRIAILEEMARRLYEEWFVRFRFPGHEGSAMTGGLPAGWCRATLGSITTKIGSGATPRGGKSAYFDSGVTLIRSQNIFDYNFVDKGLAFLDDDQAAQLQGVAVEPDDVLLNITGASVARCCMVARRHLPARVNQHVMLIRADSVRMEPSYLLCAINSVEMKRQLLAYAQTGSTREALTREMMSQFAVLLPDHGTLRKFGKIAGDIFRQREILADKNANLRTTRDFLLPKLISGELDVSALPEPQAETA
ncbi:MAG TPA: hypothetical protein DCP03_15320 [Polaromonas sp.]|uniref:restriction endonuclease subunit S n=1 Tax=Polaromonas sp. UBA4122 TaxID=1947074 RepID=UPI000EBE16E8|nr:restriction endonuclease subunit S [Polaromonas sp. UBA4122]HAL39398.1 hypothetical protein [Polaromonas sp.]